MPDFEVFPCSNVFQAGFCSRKLILASLDALGVQGNDETTKREQDLCSYRRNGFMDKFIGVTFGNEGIGVIIWARRKWREVQVFLTRKNGTN